MDWMDNPMRGSRGALVAERNMMRMIGINRGLLVDYHPDIVRKHMDTTTDEIVLSQFVKEKDPHRNDIAAQVIAAAYMHFGARLPPEVKRRAILASTGSGAYIGWANPKQRERDLTAFVKALQAYN